MEESKCVNGCIHFYGGEIKHHPNCPYYPESLSKLFDDLKSEYTILREKCEGKDVRTSEKDLRVDEVCGSFSLDQAKELLFYGKTNDGTVVIDESNKKIDYVINFMFYQIHSDLRNDMEDLFWERVKLLANYR